MVSTLTQQRGWPQQAFRTFLTTTVMLFFLGVSPLFAKQVQEYNIKAVFLFNLTHFVTWPSKDTLTSALFTIGIYGKDPFGQVIDNVMQGEKKADKPIEIHRYTTLKELRIHPCDILFISSKAMEQWPLIRATISNSATLTVSDTAGFPENGGMVNLLKSEQRIQIEINRSAVRRSGLSMSAKLLNLARLLP